MNMCVQIILYFSIYVPLYRICLDSQVGTSPHCNNKGVDDVNETTELDHDVEGMEEVPNLPQDIPKALNRESKGSKPNIEETKVINLTDEAETEKPVKIEVNFPKDMKGQAHSSVEGIQGNLHLVLSRYARTGYQDRRPQDSS